MQKLDWPRFVIVGSLTATAIFVLDIAWHGTIAKGMYAGYPQRPMTEIQQLFPFLFATYVVMLLLFCFMFLRLYPARGLKSAIWWGIWGGFYVVIPNMQFFVAVRDTSWSVLGMQVVEGIVLMVMTAAAFELFYRPQARD